MLSEETSLYVQVVPWTAKLGQQMAVSLNHLIVDVLWSLTHSWLIPESVCYKKHNSKQRHFFFLEKTKTKQKTTRFTHALRNTERDTECCSVLSLFFFYLGRLNRGVAARLCVLTKVLKRRCNVGQQHCKLIERLLVMWHFHSEHTWNNHQQR